MMLSPFDPKLTPITHLSQQIGCFKHIFLISIRQKTVSLLEVESLFCIYENSFVTLLFIKDVNVK